jgi:hypothetical protein
MQLVSFDPDARPAHAREVQERLRPLLQSLRVFDRKAELRPLVTGEAPAPAAPAKAQQKTVAMTVPASVREEGLMRRWKWPLVIVGVGVALATAAFVLARFA